MPRNGSGQYALPGGINPVITQTLITSNWANTTMADLAAALTQSIARDGQTLPTANLPMGGFRHTGVGDPVLRDNYATLGFIQDGSHFQLINIAGNNAISAVLPGGLATYSIGMIVQLIPVATSTGPITLNINGIGAKPVVSSVGNQLGAGDLIFDKAYLLMYNGTSFELITGSDSASFAQAAMSGWDRPAAGPYPDITQVNATTVAIPAGTGRIIEPSARDISAVTEVSWGAQNLTLTNMAVSWFTVIGVNESGVVVQLDGNALPSAARTHIILGTVTHVNGAINSIVTKPTIYGDMTYAAFDLSMIFNNMLLSGGLLKANVGNTLHLDLNAGIVWQIGGGPDQVNGPNIVPFPDQTDITFFPVTGTSVSGAATQLVPVANYDPGGLGVITPIPGGAGVATIHRLYFMGGTLVFLYGQSTYATLQEAIASIGLDTQVLKVPAKLTNATVLALIIATKGATDLGNLTQARLVPQGGTNYSVGVAGSISEAPLDGSSYGRNSAAWVKVVDAVIAGDGIAVNSANPNKPVVSMGATFAGPKTITSGNLNLSATTAIVYSNPDFRIRAISFDASDNQIVRIVGGGDAAINRGGFISAFGNEAAGTPGAIVLTPGTPAGVSSDVLVNAGNLNVSNGNLLLTGASPVGDIVFSPIDFRIRADTVDGSDDSVIRIASGGDPGTTRGASLTLFGNEHAATPGNARLDCGTGAQILLTSGDVNVQGGRLFGTALHNNVAGTTGPTNQYISSGTYLPVATIVANLVTATPITAQWMRVGNVVTVSGRLDVAATAAANTVTTVRLSLPIASNFTTNAQAGGAGMGTIPPGEAVAIAPDATNDAVNLTWYSAGTGSHAMVYTYTYVIA